MSHRSGKRAGARVAFGALALGLFFFADASLALAAPAHGARQAAELVSTGAPVPSATPPGAPASAARRLIDSVRTAHAEVAHLRGIALPEGGEKRELAFGALFEATTRYRRTLSDAATSLSRRDRKSTRLNSSHSQISYSVF